METQDKSIVQKIVALEEWLKQNHDNPFRIEVEKDLRKLKEQQEKNSKDAHRRN